MNQWVDLDFGRGIMKAKIIGIEFHQELKKPVFHLMSKRGTMLQLTREELETHEVSN
jgi:hypothetical protein